MNDDAQEDFDREHRAAQAALNRKRIPIPEGKTMRYESTMDSSERYMCDKVWIDRLTGNEVLRYDAADPANMFASDWDRLIFYRPKEKYHSCGWVMLVYGNNGYDVISDYVVNPTMTIILKDAEELTKQLEAEDSQHVS